MQYLIDMIVLNIQCICPQLVTDLPDVNMISPIKGGEAEVLMDWYQPNATEETYLKDQVDFEIDEEKDKELLTAHKSIGIPATTLCLVKYTQTLQNLLRAMRLFIGQTGDTLKSLKD